jgi:hypothetical protein
VERPATERLDDEPGEHEAGVRLRSGRPRGDDGGAPGPREVDEIERREPPLTAAVPHRV